MGDMADAFEPYKEMHRKRVADNPNRIKYAVQQLEQHGIEYTLKNADNGHFHCRRKADNKLIQFWASTGKIMGYEHLRGIYSLIELCEKKN